MPRLLCALLFLLPFAALAAESEDARPAQITRLKSDDDAPRSSSSPEVKKEAIAPLAVVLVVPRDPVATEACIAFEKELTAAIAADARLRPVDLNEKLGGATPIVKRPEVEERFAAAKVAYDNLDLEAAANEYMAGLKLLLEKPQSVRPAEAARAFTQVGSSWLLNGDAPKAAASFRRAIVLCPSYSPDTTEFSPEILTAFESARKEVAAMARGALTVAANAPGALVTVDGTPAGSAPATVKDLPIGKHHVLVEARGHSAWAAFVDIGDGTSPTVDANLNALPAAARVNKAGDLTVTELAAPTSLGASDLGKELGAKYVVVAAGRTEGASTTMELGAYETGAIGGARKAVTLKKGVLPESPTFAADVKALAAQIVTGLLAPPMSVAAADESGSVSGTPVYKKWWFWTGVGAVVAGTVTVAIATSGPPRVPSIITGIP